LSFCDRVHGGANPIGGQRVGLVHACKDRGQLRSVGLHQSFPGPRGLTISNPLRSNRPERLQQGLQIRARRPGSLRLAQRERHQQAE